MKPYDIAQIFSEMELELIKSMKRNLSRHEAEERKLGFEWEQWQRRKLQALAAYRKENQAIINGHGEKIDAMIDRLLKGSFEGGALQVDGLLKRLWNRIKHLFIAGQLTSPITTVDDSDSSFFRVNGHRINALINVVKGDLRNGRVAMMRQTEDVYRRTIYRSVVYLNTGATSLNQAIDMATKDFLDRGFNCIQFADGRTMNIASYAETVLRTASQRAVFVGEGTRRAEWGIRTVVISSHANSSDLCIPWQGKVFIDDVYSGGKSGEAPYPLLSMAMGNGLFHPNCRHNMSTFIPGISSLPKPVDDRQALVNYEAEQKQRYMERNIRQYKRLEAGSVDGMNQVKYGAKVEQWQSRLKNHLAKNPHLRRDNLRVQSKTSTIEAYNGLKKKFITIPETTAHHASKGDFTNPKNPKKQAIGKFKNGGHGQDNIKLLDQYGIEYNIVKEYPNGVRIGNVPSHKDPLKQTGTKQTWFPKHWADKDIDKAGTYVANIKDETQFILVPKSMNDEVVAIFKYANYKDVTVGICYDVRKDKVTTIFPDETQRLIGGE